MRYAVVSLLLIASGCGGSDGPELHDASGVVTYEGQPLPNASIMMTPTESGPVVLGKSDETGAFTLTTSGKPGAIAGSYNVAITAVEASAGSQLSSEELQAQYEKEGKMPESTSKSLIPAKYALSRTSGLTAEIKAGEANELKFALTAE